jgi:hypothetical protein
MGNIYQFCEPTISSITEVKEYNLLLKAHRIKFCDNLLIKLLTYVVIFLLVKHFYVLQINKFNRMLSLSILLC